MSILKDVMSKRVGCVVVSALLGLGLATMFHRVCVGRDCVVLKGPSVDTVTRHTWRSGADCFRYKVEDVECPDEAVKQAVRDAASSATDPVVS